MAERIKIELILDADGAVKGVKTADGALVSLEKTTDSVDTKISKLGQTFVASLKVAAAGAALALGAALKEAVFLALDMERAMNILGASIRAANREFGEGTGSMERWEGIVDDLSKKFGLLKTEVAEATARTITMTKRLGLNADQMEVVLNRAAALAIGKTDLNGAVERVTAALRGEAESAEFLGLSLNENTVKSEALALGLKEKLWSALTDVEKAQVRYLVFLKQTNEVMAETPALLNTTAQTLQTLKNEYYGAAAAAGAFVIKVIEATAAATNFVRVPLNRLRLRLLGRGGESLGSVTGESERVGEETTLTLEQEISLLIEQLNSASRAGSSGGKGGKGGKGGVPSIGPSPSAHQRTVQDPTRRLIGLLNMEMKALKEWGDAFTEASIQQTEATTTFVDNYVKQAKAQRELEEQNARFIAQWAGSVDSMAGVTNALVNLLTQQITAYASLAIAKLLALNPTTFLGAIVSGGIGILLGGLLGELLSPLRGSGGFSSSGGSYAGGGFTTSVGRAPSGGRSNLNASGGGGGLTVGEFRLRGDTAVAQIQLRQKMDSAAGVT